MRNEMLSPIILFGTRLLSPYIMLFGLYVIAHGHYSPGGGFQGGALLAASILLIRLASGQDIAVSQLKESVTMPMALLGIVIYFGTGLVSVLMGGYFLDYSELPIPGLEPEMLRFYGLLIIEVGIGLAVMAILVMLYDNMVKGED
jgi:multicomponent Na+:H+ antiporter subunit B